MRTHPAVYDLPSPRLWRLQLLQRGGLFVFMLAALVFGLLLQRSWWYLIGFLPTFLVTFALVLVGIVYDQENERRAKFWPARRGD